MVSNKTKSFIFLYFLLFIINVFSQETKFIKGKLLDTTTKEPIPFATIQIKGKSIGVISNSDGSFIIPYRYLDLGSTLIVSCLGYKTKEILMTSLSPLAINDISLRTAVLELNEAVVTAKRRRNYSARKIVKNALKSIPDNYPNGSFSLIGYYRDYQLEEKKYVNLNEAILEVYDQGFDENDYKSTKVLIYEERSNTNFEIDSISRQKYDYRTGDKIIERAYLPEYGGNEFVILRIHNPIRNFNVDSFDFINVLEKDFVRNHTFTKKEDVLMDGEPLYTIEYERNHPNYVAKGIMQISQFDFSIYKMKYSIYDKTNSKGESIKNLIDNNLIFEVITEYRKLDNKMYLNYISFQNTFMLKEQPEFHIKDIAIDFGSKCLIINFNLMPTSDSASEQSSYRINFNNKLLKFKNIKVKGKSVLLYPDMEKSELVQMFERLVNNSANDKGLNKLLNVDIQNIRSINGKVLNNSKFQTYNQFREFFVQKVNKQKVAPKNASFMKKDKPIFQKQNIVQPLNERDYWMNPPLKSY